MPHACVCDMIITRAQVLASIEYIHRFEVFLDNTPLFSFEVPYSSVDIRNEVQ